MRRWPATITVFQQRRMACVGCAIAPFNSVARAAEIYGIPPDTFLAELELVIARAAEPAGWRQTLGRLFGEAWSGIRQPGRLPILLLALLALLAALWAGLYRLGWLSGPLIIRAKR